MTQTATLPKTKPDDVIEELVIPGEQLTDSFRQILREGNIRRILVKRQGEILLEIPFTFGLLFAGLAPAVAFPGLFGLVLIGCNIEIVRVKEQVEVKTAIRVEQPPLKPEPPRPAGASGPIPATVSNPPRK
jgi:hypothetical protein